MATITKQHTFSSGGTIYASEVNTNFDDLFSQINNNVVHTDGTNALTALLSGPAADPTADNHLARKRYVDDKSGGLVVSDSAHSSGSVATIVNGAASTWHDWSAWDNTIAEQDGHTYEIRLQVPNFSLNVADTRIGLRIRRDAVEIARHWSYSKVVDYGWGVDFGTLYTASADDGSVDYDVQAYHLHSGTAATRWSADSAYPARFWIIDHGTGV